MIPSKTWQKINRYKMSVRSERFLAPNWVVAKARIELATLGSVSPTSCQQLNFAMLFVCEKAEGTENPFRLRLK
jgi:hypothetical protein